MVRNIAKPSRSLTLRKFVKRLGYHSARSREFKILLKMLLNKGLVEIQQSGYLAHSAMHPKLIVIHEPLELENIEHINRQLRVNFKVGDFTVHRATKKFTCNDCKSSIFPGERYGSYVRVGRSLGSFYDRVRRRLQWRRRPILSYKTLCLPCLIGKYDEIVI